MASFSELLVYTASSVQLDFVAQVYVAILSYSFWFCMVFFLQLLVLYGFLHTAGFCITDLFGYFHTAPGFVWLLPWFCMVSRDRILNSVISCISSRISKQVQTEDQSQLMAFHTLQQSIQRLISQSQFDLLPWQCHTLGLHGFYLMSIRGKTVYKEFSATQET